MEKIAVITCGTTRSLVDVINQEGIQKQDIVSLFYNPDLKIYMLFYYKKRTVNK